MTKNEITKKMKNFEDKFNACNSDEERDDVYAEMDKFFKEECNKITIHFPHLGENFKPVMERTYDCKCPHGYEHQCEECDQFVCYKGGDEIFSFMTFEAYCAK